jgi:hypothetical protein
LQCPCLSVREATDEIRIVGYSAQLEVQGRITGGEGEI